MAARGSLVNIFTANTVRRLIYLLMSNFCSASAALIENHGVSHG